MVVGDWRLVVSGDWGQRKRKSTEQTATSAFSCLGLGLGLGLELRIEENLEGKKGKLQINK